MKYSFSILVISLALFLAGAGAPLRAEASEVAGWIPYWAATKGFKDAKRNFDSIDTVHLFAYTIKKDGSLLDQMKLDKSTAKRFVTDANQAGVEVIPTIMTSNTNGIHALLSSESARADHIEEIVRMVEEGDYAGVDIDYEGKKAETKEYFSLFLTELKEELGSKTLSCTIEARTPADSLYTVVPGTLRYANDLDVIGDVCDVVNVMTYDQQRADLKLNKARQGAPYYPVADPEWVEKVAKLMTESIPESKLMLGVATYGREVEVTVSPEWFQSYDSLWAVNPSYALSQAKKAKVTPTRNAAGELSYTYLPKKSKVKFSKSLDIPSNTPKGMEVAARALAHANKTGDSVKFNMVWWSDAVAVAQKADLAENLGLRGIALFKIDGGEDKAIWNSL